MKNMLIVEEERQSGDCTPLGCRNGRMNITRLLLVTRSTTLATRAKTITTHTVGQRPQSGNAVRLGLGNTPERAAVLSALFLAPFFLKIHLTPSFPVCMMHI
jgi:hypothetical protein